MSEKLPVQLCRGRTRAGNPCGNPRLPGGFVCRMHGGATPNTVAAARARMAHAAARAAERLAELVGSRDELVAARASVAVLDRTGLGPSSTTVALDGGPLRYELVGVDPEDV